MRDDRRDGEDAALEALARAMGKGDGARLSVVVGPRVDGEVRVWVEVESPGRAAERTPAVWTSSARARLLVRHLAHSALWQAQE